MLALFKYSSHANYLTEDFPVVIVLNFLGKCKILGSGEYKICVSFMITKPEIRNRFKGE